MEKDFKLLEALSAYSVPELCDGMKEFPVPYVLSNCHHTLCAVGGTINEDDHAFGLDNAKKYGGIFLPPYRGVLHQYMRERMAGGGNEGNFRRVYPFCERIRRKKQAASVSY